MLQCGCPALLGAASRVTGPPEAVPRRTRSVRGRARLQCAARAAATPSRPAQAAAPPAARAGRGASLEARARVAAAALAAAVALAWTPYADADKCVACAQPRLRRRVALERRWRDTSLPLAHRVACSLARRSYLEFLSTPSVLPLRLLPRVQETIQARPACPAPLLPQAFADRRGVSLACRRTRASITARISATRTWAPPTSLKQS